MGMDFKNVEFPMKDILLAHAFDGLYNSESQKKFYNDYYYRKVRKMVSGKEGYSYQDSADWKKNFNSAFPGLAEPVYEAAVELSLKLKEDFAEFYKSLDKIESSLQSSAIIRFCENENIIAHCELEARKMVVKRGLPSSVKVNYSEEKAMKKAFNHDKTCSYDHLRKPIKPIKSCANGIGGNRSDR